MFKKTSFKNVFQKCFRILDAWMAWKQVGETDQREVISDDDDQLMDITSNMNNQWLMNGLV